MSGAVTSTIITSRLNALAGQPFRAKFHLGPAERATLRTKGMSTIRRHAAVLINERLAPAAPKNDGKQTPYRGHPVFVAQHATATCCRSCLMKWHNLAPGRELTELEQAYVVDLIEAWLKRDLAQPAGHALGAPGESSGNQKH